MTRKQIAATTFFAAVLLGACTGESIPTGPETSTVMTGTAAFAVTTAPEFLSAIRLRVIGSGITNPVAQGTARILARQQVGDTTTLLLSMTTTSGALLQVSLADRTRIPRIAVLEATAGRLGGYRAFAPATVVVTTAVR